MENGCDMPGPTVQLGSRLILLGASLLVVPGCGATTAPDEVTAEQIRTFGSLPGLRATHHKGLQDELALLVSERATPEQLEGAPLSAEAGPPGGPDPAQPTPAQPVPAAAQNDLAAVLEAAFPAAVVPALDRRIDQLYPGAGFQCDASAIPKIAACRRECDAAITQVRQALARADCTLRYQHAQGLLADTSFVDRARLFGRLELLAIALELSAGFPDNTLDKWRQLVRLIDVLAATPSLVSRRAAAELRAESFVALQAIVKHPAATRPLLADLHASLNGQLADWPADRNTWIGERAMGLHVYEMVRAGCVKDLLSLEEINLLAADGSLATLEAAEAGMMDRDEYYYLTTMRQLIEASDQPYYQRTALLHEIRQFLHKVRETSEFPTVAARILFNDLEDGHRLQSEDRAACEAWVIALAAALGEPAPGFTTHPVTGEPYQVARDTSRIVVWGVAEGAAEPAIIVPLAQP